MRRLTRRAFVQHVAEMGVTSMGVVLLGGCGLIRGQMPPKVPLIGFLQTVPSTDPAAVGVFDAFHKGLHDQGLVEGENLRIEWRWADGQNERLPALATELIGLGVQLIVAVGASAPAAVQRATDRLPIVLINGASDPSGQGQPVSLARPGSNVTGTTSNASELDAKRVELLLATLPTARRLVHLTNLSVPGTDLRRDVVAGVAQRKGVELLVLDVHRREDTEPAFEQARQWGAEALFAANLAPLQTPRDMVPGLAARSRLPAMSTTREWVDAGLLMAYGLDMFVLARRAAWYVARILNGANPGELPMERPTVFDLQVNSTTLANLGLTLPPDVVTQVTEWI